MKIILVVFVVIILAAIVCCIALAAFVKKCRDCDLCDDDNDAHILWPEHHKF